MTFINTFYGAVIHGDKFHYLIAIQYQESAGCLGRYYATVVIIYYSKVCLPF
jgi:hypothetical protein